MTDVRQGWGRGTGDAVPSAPWQRPALAPDSGQLRRSSIMGGESAWQGCKFAGSQFIPPSSSLRAQPAAMAAPGRAPGGVFGPSPVWPMGQGIPNLNGSPHPHPVASQAGKWRGVLRGWQRRCFAGGRNGETICERGVRPDAAMEAWIQRQNCFAWLCDGISASSG